MPLFDCDLSLRTLNATPSNKIWRSLFRTKVFLGSDCHRRIVCAHPFSCLSLRLFCLARMAGDILTKEGLIFSSILFSTFFLHYSIASFVSTHLQHKPGPLAFCLFIMFISMWFFEFLLHFLREKLSHHKHLLMLFHRTTDGLPFFASLIFF